MCQSRSFGSVKLPPWQTQDTTVYHVCCDKASLDWRKIYRLYPSMGRVGKDLMAVPQTLSSLEGFLHTVFRGKTFLLSLSPASSLVKLISWVSASPLSFWVAFPEACSQTIGTGQVTWFFAPSHYCRHILPQVFLVIYTEMHFINASSTIVFTGISG